MNNNQSSFEDAILRRERVMIHLLQGNNLFVAHVLDTPEGGGVPDKVTTYAICIDNHPDNPMDENYWTNTLSLLDLRNERFAEYKNPSLRLYCIYRENNERRAVELEEINTWEKLQGFRE